MRSRAAQCPRPWRRRRAATRSVRSMPAMTSGMAAGAVAKNARGTPMRRPPTPALRSGAIIRHRNIGAGRVVRIVAGQHLQGDRRVLHVAAQRSAMIQCPGQRKHAAPRDAAIGRLDPHQPAPRRRTADRAAGIRAHRHAHHARGDRGGRTGGRAAGDMLRRSRDCARAGTAGRSSGPPMANSCVASLPSSTPPAVGQLRRDDAVRRRHVIDAQLRMAGRADAGGVVDVLQRVGDAVQRPAVVAGLQFVVGAARVGQRARFGHQQKRLQGRHRARRCGPVRRGQAACAVTVPARSAWPIAAIERSCVSITLAPTGDRRNTLDGSAAAPNARAAARSARAGRHRRPAPRSRRASGTVIPARAIRQSNSAASASGDGVSGMTVPPVCRAGLCTGRGPGIHSGGCAGGRDRMRTQIGIVGAGPAGVAAVASAAPERASTRVVLEARSPRLRREPHPRRRAGTCRSSNC